MFEFFGNAANLQTITPKWLNFQILTPPPIKMQAGTLIDYQLRIRGLPVRWQTEVTVWDPPHRFVDVQKRGPYRQWIHEHLFIPLANGTRCLDSIQYAVLGGVLIQRLMVKRDVEKIFAHRARRMQELFPPRG